MFARIEIWHDDHKDKVGIFNEYTAEDVAMQIGWCGTLKDGTQETITIWFEENI